MEAQNGGAAINVTLSGVTITNASGAYIAGGGGGGGNGGLIVDSKGQEPLVVAVALEAVKAVMVLLHGDGSGAGGSLNASGSGGSFINVYTGGSDTGCSSGSGGRAGGGGGGTL